MVAAAAILVAIVLVVSIAVALGLRRWVADESRTEARLRAPQAHTVSYAVPHGVDPAMVMGTLAQAGFTSVIDRTRNLQCLLVECSAEDRAQVRHVIESVHANAYDGSELPFDHVVFEDER